MIKPITKEQLDGAIDLESDTEEEPPKPKDPPVAEPPPANLPERILLHWKQQKLLGKSISGRDDFEPDVNEAITPSELVNDSADNDSADSDLGKLSEEEKESRQVIADIFDNGVASDKFVFSFSEWREVRRSYNRRGSTPTFDELDPQEQLVYIDIAVTVINNGRSDIPDDLLMQGLEIAMDETSMQTWAQYVFDYVYVPVPNVEETNSSDGGDLQVASNRSVDSSGVLSVESRFSDKGHSKDDAIELSSTSEMSNLVSIVSINSGTTISVSTPEPYQNTMEPNLPQPSTPVRNNTTKQINSQRNTKSNCIKLHTYNMPFPMKNIIANRKPKELNPFFVEESMWGYDTVVTYANPSEFSIDISTSQFEKIIDVVPGRLAKPGEQPVQALLWKKHAGKFTRTSLINRCLRGVDVFKDHIDGRYKQEGKVASTFIPGSREVKRRKSRNPNGWVSGSKGVVLTTMKVITVNAFLTLGFLWRQLALYTQIMRQP